MATVEEMRTCRTIGHAWYSHDAEKVGRYSYRLILRCERCGAYRQDPMETNGLRYGHRRYIYPDGYRDAEISSESKDDRRAWLLKELIARSAPVVDLTKRRKRKSA